MKPLKKLNDFLCAVLRALSLVLVSIFTCLVIFQVLARNYIKISVPWTDEMAIIFFIWAVMTGTALGVRSRVHYIVDIFPSSYVRVNTVMDMAANILVFFVIIVLFWSGITYFQMGLSRNFNSIIITMGWLFISLPVSAACMILFTIENFLIDIGRLKAAFAKGVAQ
ncbi:MAG: TRAP transporter small permease subunit [Spirochaetales bacterium]|jgi:TRAP-type C4-dicarboxylate transport system permease small subunit|nr:TRAP transporter small permease subunit [Spirochaetales bacterium]